MTDRNHSTDEEIAASNLKNENARLKFLNEVYQQERDAKILRLKDFRDAQGVGNDVVLDVELRQRALDEMIRSRGVEDPCRRCRGVGVVMYGSTATWRGGMGGCAMTKDVCDACWGSGDRYRHGVDLRKLRDEENQRVAERAVSELARSCGATFPGTASRAVCLIVGALDKIADKRGKPAADWLPEMARGLANTLRRAMNVAPVKERQ